LQTDEFGNILRGDTTDWCFNSTSLFNFKPAFPNPTNDVTKLDFQFSESDTVSIYYIDLYEDTVYVMKDQALNPGHYQYEISGRSLRLFGRVVRFYIKISNREEGGAFCRHYGDIQFYY
jgi:hypothetical protein